MYNKLFMAAIILMGKVAFAQNNTGIGTTNPLNKLHVVATSDPLRLEGLQVPPTSGNTTKGTLVVDGNGVIKKRDATSISAVRVSGSLTLTINNTVYFVDGGSNPSATETLDNLNEYTGHTFTAAQDGLYYVCFTGQFLQNSLISYQGRARILSGSASGATQFGLNPYIDILASSNGNFVGSPRIELIKLTAGQTIQFDMISYATGGNINVQYTINIFRLD